MSGSPKLKPEVAGRLPKRVVIVGNNESAWMTAAILGHQFRAMECRITVLSSGTPQVEFPGETTMPSLAGLLANLQVDEHEMMRQCQATYQVATQFSDWVQSERDFWMPFAPAEHRTHGLSLFEAWFAERSQGRLLRPFHSYSLHWGAALGGKGPYGFSGPSLISRSESYAFHLNGAAFAAWLRSVAIAAAVEEISGEIATVASNGRGGVAQIRLKSGTTVASDFFVDCTGPASKLLRQTIKDPFESWSREGRCDRLLSVQLPGRRQIPPFTRITGLKAGWSWQIPLAGTIDAGYAYSSQLAADEIAWQHLQDLLKLDGASSVEEMTPACSSLSAGRQANFWRDNVLAIGTAAFQIEPFVSAGRHLTQLGIELFLELFPERSGHKASADYYNERMKIAVDEIRDFSQLHYHLSRRNDSPFWQTAAQAIPSQNLTQRLALYTAAGTVGPVAPEALGEPSYLSLLTGCGRLPGQPTIQARAADPALTQRALRDILKANEAALKDLPLHEELLDWIHLGGSGLLRSA